ncbi:MAG: hypothetical protein AB7O48_08570 [Cyclobacteriaceae bacterium]
MSIEINALSRDILIWSSIAIASLGIFRWKRIPSSLRIFTALKISSFSCDLAFYVLIAYKIPPNHASTLYQIIELGLLSWMYYLAFDNKMLKSLIKVGVIVLTTAGIINWHFIQKAEINSYTYVVDSITLLIVSLYFFFWYTAKSQSKNLERKALFWINTGLVIYLSATLLLFMATDYLIKVLNDNLIAYWTYHNIMAIIANLFFFYGLWIAGRKKPDATPASSY